MKSFITAYCLITCALIPTLFAAGDGWIGFGDATQPAPVEQAVTSSWESVTLEFTIPGIYVREISTKGGEFTELSFQDLSFKGEVGSPKIPVLRRFVEVPYGATISLEVSTSEPTVLSLTDAGYPNQLVPAQAPVPKLPGALERAPFVKSAKVYGATSFLAQEFVRIQDDDYMRGTRIVVLEIAPLAYNPTTNEIRYVSELDIRLNLQGVDRATTLENARRYASKPFEEILGNLLVNHGAYRNYEFPPSAPISYLIISSTAFQTGLQPFVDWKTSCGYEVVVVDAPTPPTTTAVKNIILEAYQTWDNPPAYVLLFGDTDTLPHYTGEASGSADDNAYTELEGTGYWTPDVMIGRMPVRSTTDITNMLTKILQVDQMTMPSTDYFKDSVWLASSDHSSMLEATHEWCFANHIDPYDPPNNTAHSVYERLGGDTVDFAFNVNAGRGIVAYSGHGYGDGSGTASVHFVHSDVTALTNANLYGHVMVFACGTNLHDQPISFGERWLLEANKGSASYWGTSESSYWTEDDNEQREIFRCQHEDLVTSLSGMYFMGLIEVYETGGDSDYYFDIYNLMGDPSADLVTRIPLTPLIDSPVSTTPNEQDFAVNITANGGPVTGALVAITMDGALLGAGYTDATGLASVHIAPTSPGEAVITVSGHNLIPTQQNLLIMPAGCGAVALDGSMFNCDDVVTITVWDSHLNLNPGVIDTAIIDISSTSEPTSETVTLYETDPDSAAFRGTIMTSETQSGLGYLLLAHADTITAHYLDADCEGSPVDVYDTATADCQGPTISNLMISELGVDTVTISWLTDEAATTVVTWGESVPPATEETDAALVTEHSVTLDILEPCTQYYLMVSSVDVGGNVAIDDNGGQYYTFTTLQLILFLSENMDANPGWTYTGSWAWGQPAGSGGDPTSGYTGNNVVGYNLNGAYDDDMTATYMTTPSFDCSSAGQVYLSFWRWLGVESASYDHATIEISNNAGASWNVVWTHTGSSVTPSAWDFVEYDLTTWAAGESDVRLRWGMGPTDGSVSYCGWNIDDVMVSYTTACNVPILVHESHEIDDSAGNNDGEINAGETIALTVTLANQGLPATGVSGSLTSSNPHVTITTAVANYPDIPQSGSGTSLTDYVFSVSTEATDGEIIPFSLAWTSVENSGTTSFTAMIVAPTLQLGDVLVLDSAGDGDAILDPGETVQIMVNLNNSGNGLASAVSAQMSSTHSEYITIEDNTAAFPDIPGGGSGTSLAPHFTVTASSSIPDHTLVTFTLAISAQGYTVEQTFTHDVTISTFGLRYSWNMDTNPNWTCEGAWAWGVPQGNDGDPTSGYTGTNVYGYNLAGEYENSMIETHLTSGPINCGNLAAIEIHYMKWLGIESSSYDHAAFKISTNNGSTWTTIWSHTGGSVYTPTWTAETFDLSQYADYQPAVLLRWTMGTTDSSVTYCGWNLDDIEIWAETAGAQPTWTPAPPTNTPTNSPTRTPTRTPTTPATVTPTATPTIEPTEPATETPEPTPPPPTPTSTPTATNPPVTSTPVPPTETPQPTPTVEPTMPPATGMILTLNATDFGPGDQFLLVFDLNNSDSQAYDCDAYVLLGFAGLYWCWPSWISANDGLDYDTFTVPARDSIHEEVLNFDWPTGTGSASGLEFYGAAFQPNGFDLIGDLQYITFSYHE